MRVRNDTPFRFAARPTSLEPPQIVASCVLRGAFKLAPGTLAPLLDELGLAQGTLRGETFAEDDDDRAGQALYPGDFADWKLESEVMFVGSAHAPGGRAVTELPVKLALGSMSKALLVTGPRVFVKSMLGDGASDPAAFVKQRLDWSVTWGGPDVGDNPVGAGRVGETAPSVFYPGEQTKTRADRARPAGLGPISSTWAPRVKLRGNQYDSTWQKTRAPWFSADFDGRYFQAAPADQRLGGFLKGDEKLALHNLHPTAPVLEASLPALRPRAFVRDTAGKLHEAKFLLDTVFIDGDAGVVFLTWRAHVPSLDVELRDLAFAVVATESLAEPPKPAAHYDALLRAFEADPTGAEALKSAMKKEVDKVADTLPDNPPPKDDDVIRLPKDTKSKVGDLGAGVVDKVAGMVARANQNLPREGEAAKRLESAVATSRPPSPLEARRKAAEQIAALETQLEKARADAVRGKAPPETIAKLDEVLADPRLKLAQAEARRFRPPTEDELVPHADLSERSLAELDLRGKDLRGADLSGVDFTDADLTGAKLAGAKLSRARLVRTLLDDADLSEASLAKTVLIEARGARVKLVGAALDGAVLTDIDLGGADLRGATAKMCIVTRAKLAGANLERAKLEYCLFDRADLEGASLASASLHRVSVQGSSMKRANLKDAAFDESSFNECALDEADLRGARGRRVSFLRANLERADLRRATLIDCHFSEARARHARFFAANLKACRFRLAVLDDADFSSANLFGADLGRASLHRTSFRKANLYASQWHGSAGKDTDLVDANLTLSTLVRW
ncbi:MAG: DUF2169 domain-containing protein [Polyangiaceae bacterium]